MKKITQFADKLVDLIRKVEIKTDNNIEAEFFLEMLDLFVLAERKERDELKKYEDLEEQGLLLELPCKIDSTVYAIVERYIAEYKVKNYIINETGITAIRVLKQIGDCDYSNIFYIEDFNKTVFLTREEAEAALRKNKECNQNG